MSTKLAAGQWVVSDGRNEGCGCRIVSAECWEEAVTECVGIAREAIGETRFHVAYVPRETVHPCCDSCTVA